MIKVNLLPQELLGKGSAAKAQQSSDGGLVVFLALFGFVVVVGTIFGYSINAQYQAEKAKKEADARAKTLEGELRALRVEYEELESMLRILQNQKAVLDALDPPDRLLWSKKLNMLPMLVPENVFLTDIVLTEKVSEIETEESLKANQAWVAAGSKGTPPPKEKVPVIDQKMELTGLAYSPEGKSENRLQRITEFRTNLESKDVKIPYTGKVERYIAGFRRQVGISAIELTSVMERDVSKFTFSLQAEQVKVNLPTKTEAPKPPAGTAKK